MGFLHLLSSLFLLSLFFIILSPPTTTTTTTAQPSPPVFKCSTKTTCTALAGYIPTNSTTLARIKTLFQVTSLPSLLSANGLPPTTPTNQVFPANQAVRIPFPCRCGNNTGVSDHVPIYKVVKDDGLYVIANSDYGGLVAYPQIQTANSIKDANLILVGQELWIPLPCSCDDVDGQQVIHYAHVVESGSTLDEIAANFGTTSQTLMSLNGISDPKKLIAGQVLDVPLKACGSSIKSNSSDFQLLAANGTSIYSANDCVRCSCDGTNNFTLQCEPSELKPTNWSTCPPARCSQANLLLGKSTSSGCNGTTCTDDGYTKSEILTSVTSQNSCPAPSGAWKVEQIGWSWVLVLLSIQFLMLHRFL